MVLKIFIIVFLKQLILIDPLDDAKDYAEKLSKKRNVNFIKTALGKEDGIKKEIKIQKDRGKTSLLEISDINMKDDFTEVKKIEINTLDTVLNNKEHLGKIGIKIDVEGYELEVILGAKETLKNTQFVIAEVRHNHESLKMFINYMNL